MTIRRIRLLAQLLGVLVAVLVLGRARRPAATDSLTAPPAGVWVTLDGQRVIEPRGAAGSQTPEGLAAPINRELLVLARDNTF